MTGKYARKAREKAGLTMQQLSDISGISVHAIYNLENERACTRIDTIEILSSTLGVHPAEYMFGVKVGLMQEGVT